MKNAPVITPRGTRNRVRKNQRMAKRMTPSRKGLVKLRRVAWRQSIAKGLTDDFIVPDGVQPWHALAKFCRENYRPWHRCRSPGRAGRPAIKLSIDEVRAADDEQANRRDDTKTVADPGPRKPMAPRKPIREGHQAENSAVTGHAPFPDFQGADRILRDVAPSVKNDPPEPAAKHHTEDRGERDEISNFLLGHFGVAAACEPPVEQVADKKREDVRDAIPARTPATDLENKRAEIVKVRGKQGAKDRSVMDESTATAQGSSRSDEKDMMMRDPAVLPPANVLFIPPG
jgi:hypothetical protein